MTPYETLRDEFTDQEIIEFVERKYDAGRVTLDLFGIQYHWGIEPEGDDAGWHTISEEGLAAILEDMRREEVTGP